ncbi:hypothetical protein BKA62DRAFT_62194 [Auriculariales sp. MPI-PUGE-AT-0066]|nr:hypothetical protein BKA62DRAFT_62194 [Auriculariales sp. MPI-PUGE-AT-0066]
MSATPNAPVSITEDEAALYDRQIRLWGLEAQQRMRNAAILVIGLKGVATETIKNIVLAGIGRLVVLDPENLTGEDLGAGFFFRDDEVGQKRVDAAKPRIQSLNPLVQVDVISDQWELKDDEKLESLVRQVDLVILTDASQSTISRVNDISRRNSKPFYCGGTYGLTGYIFVDLLRHEYVATEKPKPGSTEPPKTIRTSIEYNSFGDALAYNWSSLKRKVQRDAQPALIFTICALWEYEKLYGRLPDSEEAAAELESLANARLKTANVMSTVLTAVPSDRIASAAVTAAHEFTPVCAIVGGLLGQDVLKSLGRRDAPMDNFFVFDGVVGSGSVLTMRAK